MRIAVVGVVDELIERYDLHRGATPVDLEPLARIFPFKLDTIGHVGMAGMCLPSSLAFPTEAMPCRIVLHSKLGPRDTRLVYAHEIGHGLHRHEGSLALRNLDEWFEIRAEREAWEVAAKILIPSETVWEYGDVALVAAACEVPRWLVDIRQRLYG